MIFEFSGIVGKNQGVNSKNDSTLHHRRLTSPTPAIPIVNTQTNSGTVAALVSTLFKFVLGNRISVKEKTVCNILCSSFIKHQ